MLALRYVATSGSRTETHVQHRYFKPDDERSLWFYSLDGEYLVAFGNWKFRFVDQLNRIKVIQEVFGVEVPMLHYVQPVRHMAIRFRL
jgi:hypothetical protein